MASIHSRNSSSAKQCSVIVHGKRITRSLAGVKNADDVSAAVGALALNLRSGPAKLKLLIDAVFEAAGVANPYVKAEAEIPLFMDFTRAVLRRKAKKLGEDAIANTMRACLLFEKAHPRLRLNEVKPTLLQDFYDVTSVNCAPTTANNRIRAIGSILRQAVKQGILLMNPISALELAEDASVLGRQPMSEEMIDDLNRWLLESEEPDARDWYRAILVSRGAGLRLMDAVNVTLDNFRKVGGMYVLSANTRKTGIHVDVPILYQPLVDEVEHSEFTATTEAERVFCPFLRLLKDYNLSKRFSVLVKKAGITTGVVECGKRRLKTLSFHCLRHGYVTSLHEMGLPSEITMKLTGHKSAAVHAGYSHASVASLIANIRHHVH